MLAYSPAQEAIDFSASLMTEPVAAERSRESDELQSRQRRIIDTLTAMLSLLHANLEQTTKPGDQLVSASRCFQETRRSVQALDETAAAHPRPDRRLGQEARR